MSSDGTPNETCGALTAVIETCLRVLGDIYPISAFLARRTLNLVSSIKWIRYEILLYR